MNKNRVVMNSLGEFYRGDDCLCSSINLAELSERLGKPVGYEPTEAEIEEEFDRRAREVLNAGELQLYRRVAALQRVISNSRFRVYGRRERRRNSVILVSEFRDLVENRGTWALVKKVAKATEAKVWVMDESKCLDKSAKIDPVTQKRGPWRYGKNHGKMERQVELSWPIADDMRIHEVVGMMLVMAQETHELWKLCGMGVL